ncbi:unnamed protein product [Prorocentrum cordatum]|uniref:Pentacotripeptide-repeat region of PRORP domain-containing protein n=1 Tax=Prorocentrum cordatum TaxID=2364126 RepID=A0ABN9T8W9_9DINO|nr:unnamed protein product [Polarella glacialis]
MSLEASIKNCGQTKQWSAALRMLREGIQFGLQLVPSHYVAIVSACRKGGQWQHALSVFSEMLEAKLEPDSLLQRWDQRVRERRAVAAGAGTAEGDAGGEAGARRHLACEKGGQWQPALALLSEIWEAKLPDVISYNAGISACEKGEQWELALALLSEMREAKLEPDVISYSAGISACEKGGKWQAALALLSEMREAKLEPNAISYSGSVPARKASSGSGRWHC